MELPKLISDEEAKRFAYEWASGATLGDLAIRYLGYSSRDPLGTRASASHRFLRQFFDRLGYGGFSLSEMRSKLLGGMDLCKPTMEARAAEAVESRSVHAEPLAAQPAESDSGERKVLVISDLHIPFHHIEMLDWVMKRESDAHELVILGDFWDMYAASRFVKDRHIDVLEELDAGYELILGWLHQFQKVVFVTGNHDKRPTRLVARNNPEVLPLVFNPIEYIRYQLVVNGYQDLLSKLVVPQYPVRGSHPDRPVYTDHIYLCGDALLGHFEVSRKGPASTAYRLAMEWLPVWGPLVGAGDIRVLVQGHVHRLSKSVYGRTTIIESGCCAHVLEYTLNAPLSFSPPGLGYVVLYQQDLATDVNRSGYFCYDIYPS